MKMAMGLPHPKPLTPLAEHMAICRNND